MDAASLAALVTAVGGLAFGALGWWQSRNRDTSAAANTAKDVATRAAEAAIGALQAALDHLTLEVAELTGKVERCEAEKAGLAVRVRELEAAQ